MDVPPGATRPRSEEQVRATRGAASDFGIPLVIDARTDVFLASVGEPESRLDHAVRQVNAYRDAGADSYSELSGKSLRREMGTASVVDPRSCSIS